MSQTDTQICCFHCGEYTDDGQRWATVIDGQLQPMCCPGCKAVAETIVASGLKDYYKHRTDLPDLSPSQQDNGDLAAREALQIYDSSAMQQQFVVQHGEQLEATLIIEGISCAACGWLIEHRLKQLDGVDCASLNLSNHRLNLRWQPQQQQLSQLMEAIARLGYQPAPFSATEQEAQRKRESRQAIRRLAVAGIGMMQVMMISVPMYVGMELQYENFMRIAALLLTLPVVLFSARPFFDAALRDLRSRHLTMDVPVSLAIILAFSASIWSTLNQGVEVYFDSVCMFTFFLLLGRFLEMRARHRMGQAGNNLMTLLPTVAIRLRNGHEEVVATQDIQLGDELLLKPGQAIPADGVVLDGRSSVDEAALTGEYLPVKKQPGDAVIGGTFNVESPLTMCVRATGAEAQLSTIMRLMGRAQQEKPAIALLADRVASYFVVAVLLISASVAGYWWWQGNPHAFFIALSVLVVTCPCALSLATPTALTAATAALRESGLLISKGHVLESMTHITRLVFDKTGTLTLGRLTLAQCQPLSEHDADACLAIIAGLERHSTHPIAHAFKHLKATEIEDVVQTAGEGIQGLLHGHCWRFGHSQFASQQTLTAPSEEDGQWLLLSCDWVPQAWVLLNDSVRKSAQPLIQGLQQQGLKVALLTGDPSPNGMQLASSLGIDDVAIGQSPDDKLQAVRRWQQQGEHVLMVGDGINDVPVLAGADLSLAVNDASDLAKTNADCMLTNGNLNIILQALNRAHLTRRIIRQNIGWALGYNLIALPVAAAGLVPPWTAAIGMSFSSLLVVTNALRLVRHNRG